jgi:hypothetical protein
MECRLRRCLLLYPLFWAWMKKMRPKKIRFPFGMLLRLAYINNPTLRAARARTKSVFEKMPRRMPGYLPTVLASGEINTIADQDCSWDC